jgi:twitching motility protein PilT
LIEINQLLQLMVEKGGSDLHLAVGRPPVIRLHGRLRPLNTPDLTPEDTIALMKSISPAKSQQELSEKGGSDFAFGFGQTRFRVAIFKQKGVVGIVLRQIPSKLLSFEDIGLAHSIKNLLTKPRGLMLVTGPTGSGKSTTLASMIDFINTEYDRHIITIEDPIEYYHNHRKSLITQREVGVDVTTFAEGLRRALRMNPDVILVGEMRDLETIATAITAAETGHLVFGTLHTTGSAKTLDRMIDAFPKEQQEQVRVQLSSSLIAVISQLLLPRVDKPGLIAAFEVMICIPAVSNLMRENKTFKIESVIQTSKKYGMVTMDDSLFELFIGKKITYADMMQKAQDPISLQQKVKDYTEGQQGQPTPGSKIPKKTEIFSKPTEEGG